MALDLLAARAALQQSRQKVVALEAHLAQATQEIQALQAQLAALTPPFGALATAADPATAPVRTLPPFVKANHVQVPADPPGQKAGHAPAHRPVPLAIDQQVQVPLPKDRQGKPTCPQCFTQLQQIQRHRRIVEDLVPQKRVVSCYLTTSGYCPSCRQIIESRAEDQPPVKAGLDLPQSQLGINVLATAALLRMVYRLPYRQITQLYADLPGLSICPGGVARQIQRMGRWLDGQYQTLKRQVPGHKVVHIDETGWRVGGVNHWLWALKGGDQTLYHIDKSRGRKVARELLGNRFKGTLVSDFYSAYHRLDCPKQKCLAHWSRELKETAELHREFARGAFYLRALRLVQAMLLLKDKQPAAGRGPPQANARYQKRVRKIEQRLRQLAKGPPEGWQENQTLRLAKRLARHGNEFTHFLRHPEVPGTNNAAERALRPAVVARKISGGNRSQANASAESVLRSILTTISQQHKPLLETFKKLLRGHWSGQDPTLLTDLLSNSR
jgi:transposase-like protein